MMAKTYRIFDEDSSGTVDFKELAIGIEFLAEGSTEDKLESTPVFRKNKFQQ